MEAYIGEYASGKSEIAINRAIELSSQNRKVSLVDLDIVEPCYTLRPLKKQLNEMGIFVLTSDTKEFMGLGEAGNIIKPASRWALKRDGDIILDIGYGIEGSRTLNLLEGADNDPDLKILAVLNASRPMTSTPKEMIEYLKSLGRVDGLINNTHLGEETTSFIVKEGFSMIDNVAKALNLPIVATVAIEKIAKELEELNCDIWAIRRYMPNALW